MLSRFKAFLAIVVIVTLVAGCETPQQQNKKAAAARWEKMSARIKIPVAQEQFDNGKYNDAAKTIGECLKADPNLPQAHLLAGKILFAQGQTAASLNQLQKTIALDDKLDDAWYWLGIVNEDQKQIANALDDYQKALNLNSNNVNYILAYVRACIALDKEDEALAFIQEKVAVLPAEVDLKAKCADLLNRKQKYDQAIALYEQAVLLDPQRLDIAESLGYCCIIAGHWSQAADVFTKLIASCSDGDKKEIYLQLLGTCQVNAGQYGGAINSFSKLSRRDNPQIWLRMGQAALGAGDADRAYACSMRALALQPGYPDAIAVKGSAEYLKKNYNDAVKSFEQIISAPQHASFAKTMLARCYQHIDDEKAHQAAQKNRDANKGTSESEVAAANGE